MIDIDGVNDVRYMGPSGTQYRMVKVVDETQSFDNYLGRI